MKNLAQVALITAATLLAFGAHAVPIFASNNTPFNIPDNNAAGVSSTISIADLGLVEWLTITFAVNHTSLGELIATLSHGGETIFLMNQPGQIGGNSGDNSNLASGFPLTFSALATQTAASIGSGCGTSGVVGSTVGCANALFLPQDAFTPFHGMSISGDWVLKLSDNASGDVGNLQSWQLNFETISGAANPVPEPAMLALVALALVGVGASRRRRAA